MDIRQYLNETFSNGNHYFANAYIVKFDSATDTYALFAADNLKIIYIFEKEKNIDNIRKIIACMLACRDTKLSVAVKQQLLVKLPTAIQEYLQDHAVVTGTTNTIDAETIHSQEHQMYTLRNGTNITDNEINSDISKTKNKGGRPKTGRRYVKFWVNETERETLYIILNTMRNKV